MTIEIAWETLASLLKVVNITDLESTIQSQLWSAPVFGSKQMRAFYLGRPIMV